MGDNLVRAVPMLHVSDMQTALAFYCGQLGFSVTSEYKQDPDSKDAYVAIQRDEAKLHLSSFAGDGKLGGVAVVIVRDVDTLFQEFRAKGVNAKPVDQTWGNREMYVRDSDGNQVRYTQPKS
jgi:catechol 2,3-dioxygenase-like lactoylglutathione lyase family enzyme